MNRLVSIQEASLLMLVARRVLNHRRAAEKDGEEYHDLTPLTQLSCGIRARIRFEPVTQGYEPVVEIKAPSTFDTAEITQAASEILGGKVVEKSPLPSGVLQFGRSA